MAVRESDRLRLGTYMVDCILAILKYQARPIIIATVNLDAAD